MGNMTGIFQQAKEQVEHALVAMAAGAEARKEEVKDQRWSDEAKENYRLPGLAERIAMAQAMALVGILGHLDTNRQHENEDAEKIVKAIHDAQYTSIRESSMEFYYMTKTNKSEARRRKLRRWRRQLGHKIGGTTEANGAHDG